MGTIGLPRGSARNAVSARQLQLALAAAVVVVAIALRLARINRQPLWLDEHFSLWFGRQSIAYLWTVMPTYETHPPLYQIVLHGWIRLFGATAVALRSLSLVGAFATAPLLFLVARQAVADLDPRFRAVPLLVLALYAVSALQVHYAVEARPYAWLGFAWMLAVHGAIRVVRAETGVAGWAILVIGMMLTCWLHALGLLYVVALAVGLAVAWGTTVGHRARFAGNLALAAAAVLLLYLPIVMQMVARTENWAAATWLQRPTLLVIADDLSNLFGIGPTPLGRWFGLGLTIGVIALATLGGLALFRRDRGIAAILVCGVVLPVALSLGLSLDVAPIFVLRTLVATQLPYFVLLALGLCWLPRPWRWIATTSILLALGAQTVNRLYSPPAENWPRMAATLIGNAAPGDIILVLPNDAALPINYYLAAQGSRMRAVSVTPAFPALHLDSPYPSGNIAIPGIMPRDVTASLAMIEARRPPSVWLVSRHTGFYDPQDLTRHGLEVTRHRKAFIEGSMTLEAFAR